MKRSVLILSVLGVLAIAARAATQDLRLGSSIKVDVREVEGDHVLSLQADSAPLDRVLERIGAETGYEIEGLSTERRTVLVTTDLSWRPLEQALEYVLGSVGMTYRRRPGTITVLDGSTADLDPSSVMQLANAAYLRALTRFPDHPLAPNARLEQGTIAESQGYPGAAFDHYQALIEDYPKSPEVPEAYMRSGYVLQRLGRWADAAMQFRAAANLPFAKEFAASSRLELARCTIEIGDPQEALYTLASLDNGYPARTAPERARRELVRALGLSALGRYLDALRALESVETMLAGPDRVEGLRVRAIALQGAGNLGDGARAWMIYALETQEPTRAYALEQAVKLALQAEDEMGALFIVRQAEQLGHGVRFAPFKTEAYDRLGFATDVVQAPLAVADRVAQAETRIAAGELDDARRLLSDFVAGVAALEPDLRVRFAVAWSTCLAETSLDNALAYLRQQRAALSEQTHFQRRARLDIAAAALLEAREMYDQAADAYRGIY